MSWIEEDTTGRTKEELADLLKRFRFYVKNKEVFDENLSIYTIHVEKEFNTKTTAEALVELVENGHFPEGSVIIAENNGKLMFVTKGMKFTDVLKKYTFSKSDLDKGMEGTEEEREYRKRQIAIMASQQMQNAKNKTDKLFGFKQKISAGNPYVMRILDRLISFMGVEKSEGYLKQLDRGSITTEEMYDASKNDSLNNIATLSRLVKNNDKSLFVTQEEEKEAEKEQNF